MKNPNRTPGEHSDHTSDAAASSNSEPSSNSDGQDAVTLLKADHREVEELFANYEKATSSSKKASLAARICRDLIVHTLLEEELFYPACREKNVEHDDLDEAQVVHDTAKLLIAELMTEKPGDAYFDAKVKVLGDYIKLHVGEEEDPSDGIFAKALAAGVDMDALGQQIQTRRPSLVERNEFAPPNPRSLHVRTARTHAQESQAMPRYSQGQDRDEHGRFTSDNDYRYGSRYRDDDDYRRGSNGDRPRDEFGRFMHDDDYRGRDHSRSGEYARSGRNGDYRDRDENGRFMSHDERGGMYSSRSRYDDDDRGAGSYRQRDEEGRFMSDDRGRNGNDDRGRGGRYRDDDDRNGGRGWYGDPRGHAEASHRGWEHRESGRYVESGRYADDDDDRRGYAARGGRYEDHDHRGGHGGWFGDHDGHAEAARRGWRNR